MVHRTAGLSAVCFMLGLSVAATAFCAENWMVSPQLCQGKAYSQTARDAQWQFDGDQRVSYATKDSRTMYSSVKAGERANFVVNVRLRMDDMAECRVSLGDTTIELQKAGRQTQCRIEGKSYTFDTSDEDAPVWTMLHVRRWDGKMTAEVNGQEAIAFGDGLRSVERVGLQALEGTIGVQNFVVTGDLERRDE